MCQMFTIKLTNPMTNWFFLAIFCQRYYFYLIESLNFPGYIHTNPSIQIQVHRAARRRFLGERAAATYEALSRAQRNIEIEFVSLLFSDQ